MADVPFHIHYRLDGLGWATCDVSHGEKKVTVTASYLSDALGQLAAGTLLLRLGGPYVRVSFEEEPGAHRWGFDWHQSPTGDIVHVRVRIWRFDESRRHLPDDEGLVVFDGVIRVEQFYRGVLRMLDDVLATYGEAQYEEQWYRYPFPKAVHAELRRMLTEWPGL